MSLVADLWLAPVVVGSTPQQGDLSSSWWSGWELLKGKSNLHLKGGGGIISVMKSAGTKMQSCIIIHNRVSNEAYYMYLSLLSKEHCLMED